MSDTPTPPDDSLVTFADVQELLGGCARQTVYNLLKRNPAFPKPVQLTRRPLWRKSDINAFIAGLPAEKEGE